MGKSEIILTTQLTDTAPGSVLYCQMLQYLLLIREFEERVLSNFADQGKVHGPLHSSIGQEAVAVGTSAALAPSDPITSTHRGHHHFIAKELFHYLPAAYDPRSDSVPQHMHEVIARTMAEILGLDAGYAGGRGGSMHMADGAAGILGTNAIVGGGIAIATGAALKERLSAGDGVALSYFGDGALGQGVFVEAANMASLWKLPIIYLLENNLYSVATPVQRSVCVNPVSQRAAAAALPVQSVDGMDPYAVYAAVREARARCAGGEGPQFVECRTYRYKHQAGSSDGTAFGYRTAEEIDSWKRKDPCVVFPQRLLDEHVLSEAQLERMRRNAVEVVDYACRFVSEQPPASTDNLLSGLHSDGEELRDLVYQDIDEFRETKEEKYLTGISLALRRGMERDPRVFVIGEEVGRLGGAFGATKGLYHLFPDRVLDAPISEAGFVGMALGAALRGYRPVVEIMYADFALVAGDQLMNQIAKVRYMYGNQFNVPLMVRSRTAIGTGYGAQHTLDPAAFYALYPGWRIVAPSNTFDMMGLMNTALASNDPVLFIEHNSLYQDRSAIPARNLDFAVPFGQAKVYGDGEDLVVVSYSYMSTLCRKALDELRSENIACTFIDLRTLDYLHIDWTCLKRHLSRIGRMLICEQAPLHGSVGAQIADTLHRECFDSLDGPIHRLGGQNIPLPVSKRMEQCAIPQLDDVKNAIRNMVIDYSPRFGR